MQLSKEVKITVVNAPVSAASNTDDNSAILDMDGFDGVMFIVPITDSVALGVATMTVEQDAANADTSMAAVTGGAATKTSAVNGDLNAGCLVCDVYKPQKRYVQAVLTSATQNIAFGSTIAIQYNAKNKPTVNGATVLNMVSVVSPAEA